ncbi:hypothetical protein ACIOKD_17885 [Streptomyces sp. NPDC087844]|uniref:hypothetical protein n=1 Tax=Streptomyces sp. NPDC087844 TaxID=3365805 RepID=UPI00380D9E3E
MPASSASPALSASPAWSASPWITPAVGRPRTADPYVVDTALAVLALSAMRETWLRTGTRRRPSSPVRAAPAGS